MPMDLAQHRVEKHAYSTVFFLLLAADLTRLAEGRVMWWLGIQLSSYVLLAPVDAPTDSEPERAASASTTFLPFLADLVRLA